MFIDQKSLLNTLKFQFSLHMFRKQISFSSHISEQRWPKGAVQKKRNTNFKVFETPTPSKTHPKTQTYDPPALNNAGAFNTPPQLNQKRENTYISKVTRYMKSKVINHGNYMAIQN